MGRFCGQSHHHMIPHHYSTDESAAKRASRYLEPTVALRASVRRHARNRQVESQGGRRPDVAPLRRTGGAVRLDQERPDWQDRQPQGLQEGGRGWDGMVGLKPEGMSKLMYQIQRLHGFLWASGGAVGVLKVGGIFVQKSE